MIRLDIDHLHSGATPKPVWLWCSGTDATEADTDRLWQAYLRRFDIEHTFRRLKQTLGWTCPKSAPQSGRPLDLAGPRGLTPNCVSPGHWQPTGGGPGRNPHLPNVSRRPASAATSGTSARQPPARPVYRNPPAPAQAGHPAARTLSPPHDPATQVKDQVRQGVSDWGGSGGRDQLRRLVGSNWSVC